MSTEISVAIIAGGTRSPCVEQQVARFCQRTIQKSADSQDISLVTLNLADFGLPIFDEAPVPGRTSQPENYATENRLRGAQEISHHHGYILISPKCNNEMLASAKHTFDFLYHAWVGKPIGIVTYGLDGDKILSAQLVETLKKIGLQVASTKPLLLFKDGETGIKNETGMMTGDLDKRTSNELAEMATEDVVRVFEEVTNAISRPVLRGKEH